MYRLACDLACQVGDDLIGVHIGAGRRTGLKYIQRKLLHQPAIDNFTTDRGYGATAAVIESAQVAIGIGTGLLYQTQRPDKFLWKRDTAYWKILDGALRLSTISRFLRYLQLTMLSFSILYALI